jgi:hypothetical protein
MTDDETRTFTLTLPGTTGDRCEVEISAGQLLDATAGRAFAYYSRDEEVLVDEDGTFIQRENATPPIKEAA